MNMSSCRCPFCKSPATRLNITSVGVAFRCSGAHGASGLRFDSMTIQDAKLLGVEERFSYNTGRVWECHCEMRVLLIRGCKCGGQ